MAPELLAGDAPSAASDMYAVGVMLHEALFARLPDAAGAAGDDLPDAGRPVHALMTALLAPDPAARPTAAGCLGELALDAEAPRAAPPLVGREAEVGALHAATRRLASADEPVVHLLEGESGIGKTRLLERFLEETRGQPDLVGFYGRCSPHEEVPFNALDPLLDQLAHHLVATDASVDLPMGGLAALSTLFPAFGVVLGAAVPSAPTSPHEARELAISALGTLLCALSRRRALVLVLDDAHWADRDSLAVLLRLLTWPGLRALFVLAGRTPETGSLATQLGLPETEARTLRGLDGPAAQTLLAAIAPDRWAPEQLSAVVPTGLVSPFLLVHAATAIVRDHGRPSADLPELLGRRVDALGAPQRRLLELLACARTALPLEGVRTLSPDDEDPADAAESLVDAGLATIAGRGSGYVVAHDRIRAAVTARSTPAERQARASRIADLFLRGGAVEASVLAMQLRDGGRLAEARPQFLRAAELASAKLAFDQAARMYEAAGEAGATGADYEARLADALAAAGYARRAVTHWLAAAEEAGPDRAPELRAAAAEHLLGAGYVEEGGALLDQLLTDVGAGLPRAGWLRGLVALGWSLRSRLRNLRLDGARVGHEPSSVAMTTLWTAAAAMGYYDGLGSMGLQARYITQATRSGDASLVTRALALESCMLGILGRPGARLRALDEAVGRVELAGHAPALRGWVALARGYRQFSTGEFAAGRASLDMAHEAYRVPGIARWERSMADNYRAFVLLFTGPFDALEEQVTALVRVARAREDRLTLVALLSGAGYFPAYLRGDFAGARAVLAEAERAWPGPMPETVWFIHLMATVRVDTAAGEGARAVARLRAVRFRLWRLGAFQFVRVLSAWVGGLARLAVGHELARVQKDVAALRRERSAWAEGVAELLAAGLASRRGNSATAELDRAAAAFDRAGMPAYALAARGRTRALSAEQVGALRALGVMEPVRWVAMETPGGPARG
jgi:hypothetical protein